MAIWILFDPEGRVLATGEEQTDAIRSLLVSRYSGIQIANVTVTPVLGREGRPIQSSAGHTLQLHCVWLATGAGLPKAIKNNDN